MTIFLFSNDACEKQSIACIEALESKITDDIRIIYYTIGFKSDFKFKNLITHEYPINTFHQRWNMYKPELCLYTIENYKDTDYIYIDTDFIFSKNIDLLSLKHTEEYPLASCGPVEFPTYWESINGHTTVYSEKALMQYFGITQRSMRYLWTCLLTFNNNCVDFLEEWKSVCYNSFLVKKFKTYFAYQDETPFNVCLWRRGATKNLGFGFLNTPDIKKVIFSEENNLMNFCFGEAIDGNGYDWECVNNSKELIGYHAIKNIADIEELSKYFLEDKKKLKQIFIIDCYADNPEKLKILAKAITSIKLLDIQILLVTHCIIPTHIISMVDYYVYDSDNTFNEINFYPSFDVWTPSFNLSIKEYPEYGIWSHEFPILKSMRNALGLAISLGFETFIFSEYDNIFTANDINKIQQLSFSIFKNDKKFLFLKQNDEAVETIFFSGQINYMFDLINEYFPKTIEEYNNNFTYRWPYSLELFFKEMLSKNIEEGIIFDKNYNNVFEIENKNLSRVGSITAGALYDKTNDKYYLYISNKDLISYKFYIKKNNVEISNYNLYNTTFPVIELIEEGKYDIICYTSDDILFKTIEFIYDKSLHEEYQKRGTINFT